MNNENLLKVAKGMGLDAHIVSRVKIYDYTNDCFFNPSVGDLMEWLLERGNFECLNSDRAIFHPFDKSGIHVFGYLKENLLSITLQVIEGGRDE
jgi:hypothetical protein